MKKIFVLFQIILLSHFIVSAQKNDNGTTNVRIITTSQCSQCKEIIEAALAFEKGIKSSDLDLKTRELTVVYNSKKTTDAQIRSAVSKQGYDADDVKKDEKAYKKLPACCKIPDDPDYAGH